MPTETKAPPKLNRYAVQWLPVRDLHPHPTVQRQSFSVTRAKEMADNLDPDAIGNIAVIQRKGKYLIVDGQHRVWAVKEALGEAQLIPCRVYDNYDDAKAAGVFLGLNQHAAVSALDRFLVRIIHGDPIAIGIMRVLDRFKLKVQKYRIENVVQATAAYEAVWRRDPKLFANVIEVLHGAWGGDPSAYESNLVRGLAALLWRNQAEANAIDLKELSKRMSAHTAELVLHRAEQLQETTSMAATNAMSEVLAGLYNKGRRARLALTTRITVAKKDGA